MRALEPDFARLAKLPARGVVVSARDESGGRDIVSRIFVPALGVNEDPITGSAHACRARYWAAALGKDRLHGYPTSARGVALELRLRGERVELWGTAVTAWSGRVEAGPG